MYEKEQKENMEAIHQTVFLSPLKYINFWGEKQKMGNPIGKETGKRIKSVLQKKKDFNCPMNM